MFDFALPNRLRFHVRAEQQKNPRFDARGYTYRNRYETAVFARERCETSVFALLLRFAQEGLFQAGWSPEAAGWEISWPVLN
jgi:hypothetical protein